MCSRLLIQLWAGLSVEKLKPGMVLRGVVRNVVQFGAFFDIGVHHDALLHYSAYPTPLPRPDWPSVNDRFAVAIKSAPEQRGCHPETTTCQDSNT
eukprot:1778100-Amphidinium_carterae.1